jgi:hypothetical protein
MATSTKSLSASYMGVRNGVTEKTARLFMLKVREAMAYGIRQIESNRGLNFKALHTRIHQVKSWIKTTYSWVSDDKLNRYFNEFCFRINRSQSKATIFNNLIVKMVEVDKIYQSELISN